MLNEADSEREFVFMIIAWLVVVVVLFLSFSLFCVSAVAADMHSCVYVEVMAGGEGRWRDISRVSSHNNACVHECVYVPQWGKHSVGSAVCSLAHPGRGRLCLTLRRMNPCVCVYSL